MLQHDLSSVLVLTGSPITGIVVGRIVEHLGLKPRVEKPDCPPERRDAHRPFLIILDAGTDEAACDAVLADLAARRGAAARRVPRVIMLSNTNAPEASASRLAVVDRFVTKPITPDALQPQILYQLAQVRDGS